METRGLLAFETEAQLADAHRAIAHAGAAVTEEIRTAIEYQQDVSDVSVTTELVDTAEEALFASLLVVHVGGSEEFEAWLDDHPELEVHLEGHDHVDRRAWHHVGPAEAVVAVTFQNEPDAAVEVVRRQAVGRYYRDLLSRK